MNLSQSSSNNIFATDYLFNTFSRKEADYFTSFSCERKSNKKQKCWSHFGHTSMSCKTHFFGGSNSIFASFFVFWLFSKATKGLLTAFLNLDQEYDKMKLFSFIVYCINKTKQHHQMKPKGKSCKIVSRICVLLAKFTNLFSGMFL